MWKFGNLDIFMEMGSVCNGRCSRVSWVSALFGVARYPDDAHAVV